MGALVLAHHGTTLPNRQHVERVRRERPRRTRTQRQRVRPPRGSTNRGRAGEDGGYRHVASATRGAVVRAFFGGNACSIHLFGSLERRMRGRVVLLASSPKVTAPP